MMTSLCPYQDSQKHKLAYIVADPKGKTCKEIWIMPFLHDRKIYLQRIKQNTDYFFNTIKTKFCDISKYNREIDEIAKKNDPNLVSIRFDSSESNKEVTLIMCINKTESKFYVYKPNGILIRRVEFSEQTEQYGQSKAVSQDGINYIYQKNKSQLNLDDMMEIHMVTIDIFEFKYHKTINVKEELMNNGPIKNYFGKRSQKFLNVLKYGWDKILMDSQ